MLKLQILSENKTDQPDYLAEHGLSILIETNERKILFDTGASDLFLKNAARMNADLEQVDTVVISHGHYDHTEGIPYFCEVNGKAKIFIHKDSFERVYGISNGKLEDETCGIRWTKSQFDEIKDRLIFTRTATNLTENITISGTIPDVEGCQPTERFYKKGENGNLIPDLMNHEQFLAIRDLNENGNSKGIFLFSGCSHKGIEPCLQYARSLFPNERIRGLVAGMHLYHASKETIAKVVNRLNEEELDVLIPLHCTGMRAICQLKNMLGERCILAGAGDTVIL